MTQTTSLTKAELIELDLKLQDVTNGKRVRVQFNPETLKVSLANQIHTRPGVGVQNEPASRQFVGEGTTKLSLQLWFDVTDPDLGSSEQDVRLLTERVAFFITPKKGKGKEAEDVLPPGVRFVWGSFQFDGFVESMEESLELFSSDGRPLRASVSLVISQQKLIFNPPKAIGSTGTEPLTPVPAGASVQGMAARVGRQDEWWDIAEANKVEDPLRLPLGRHMNLQAGKK